MRSWMSCTSGVSGGNRANRNFQPSENSFPRLGRRTRRRIRERRSTTCSGRCSIRKNSCSIIDRERSPQMFAKFVIPILALTAASTRAADKVTYEDHLLPILRNECTSCHNPDKKKAGLDLSTYQQALAG